MKKMKHEHGYTCNICDEEFFYENFGTDAKFKYIEHLDEHEQNKIMNGMYY